MNILLFLEAQGGGAYKVKELPHLHTDGYCLCIHGHLNTAIFVVYVIVGKVYGQVKYNCV